MNDATLIAAQKWLTELGIRTEPKLTALLVNREDVTKLGLGVSSEFLTELRNGVNSKRLYWADKDNQWLHLKCF